MRQVKFIKIVGHIVRQTYLLSYEEFVNDTNSGDSDSLLLAQHRNSDACGARCHISPVQKRYILQKVYQCLSMLLFIITPLFFYIIKNQQNKLLSHSQSQFVDLPRRLGMPASYPHSHCLDVVFRILSQINSKRRGCMVHPHFCAKSLST